MSNIRLGKSRDSRTRGKAKIQEASAAPALRRELREHTAFTGYLLAKGYSTSTIGRHVRNVGNYLRWASAENIPVEGSSYNDVLHYMQGKRGKVKQRTISTEVNSLRHYFDHLNTIGQMMENPVLRIQVKGIKRRILYDILKRKELENLYHNFAVPDGNSPDSRQNWFRAAVLAAMRNRVIVGLMVYQGLSVQELAALAEKDVKLREGKIFVAGSRRSEERELALEAPQVLDMMEYILKTRTEILELTGKQGDRLFASTGQGDKFNNTMQMLVRKLNGQNGRVTSARQVRTSVIVHWLKLHNLRQVQYMAGHRFVSSTEAYLANDLEDLEEDIDRYHPIG